MMISPEMFYELHLKGKSVEETLSVIGRLKRTITKLKNKLERPFGDDVFICPSPDVQLSCNRDYLERAKMYLLELGSKYEPTPKELRAEEFNNHLCNVKRITLEFHGYCGLPEEYQIIIVDNKVKFENKYTPIQIEDFEKNSEYLYSKEALVEGLENLHIGEWRKNYTPDRFGVFILDGTQWSLEIEFNDGYETKRIYGSNAYPYNFNKLRDIFELDQFEE